MALRSLGHESKVVMPALPGNQPDESDLVVRGTMAELANPEWWKALNIDAVTFICWGFKEHTPIICAAKRAGIKTCAIFDGSCSGFPYFEVFGNIRGLWRKGFLSEPFPKRILGTAVRTIVFAAQGLVSNYHAARQSRAADISGYNTRSSLARAKRRVRLFFGREATSNMLLMAYPIPDAFLPLPREKRKERIVAVARWDAVRHKRPHVLMKVVEELLAQQPSLCFAIYGITPEYMVEWHDNLADNIQARVTLAGVQSSRTVSSAIGESMILYCPSAMEGLPLPVAEALCGGCTVVGLDTDDISGLAWALQEGDGTSVLSDSVAAHVAAVVEELNKWRNGQREPSKIAEKWAQWFSVPFFCRRLIELLESKV